MELFSLYILLIEEGSKSNTLRLKITPAEKQVK